MKFELNFVQSAIEDLDYYKVREQRIILDAIEGFLRSEANIPSKKRKQLRADPLAPWELRIGYYRVFYEIKPEARVRVLAIGHKAHNELIIRGQRVEI